MEKAEKYSTIYLVRHGETEANVGKIVAGHFDSPLTQKGERFDLRKNLSEQQKRDFKYSFAYESDSDIASRMLIFLREISVAYAGKTVLVVSHGSIMRSTLMHLGFALADELSSGSIENTGYVVLESDGVDFFVKQTVGINKVKV